MRAGDYFGPSTRNSRLAQEMLLTPVPVTRVFNPARRGVGHAWAYVPDLAETMMRLLERNEALSDFDVFHFAGCWLDDNREMADAIRRAAGRSYAPIHAG